MINYLAVINFKVKDLLCLFNSLFNSLSYRAYIICGYIGSFFIVINNYKSKYDKLSIISLNFSVITLVYLDLTIILSYNFIIISKIGGIINEN